MNRKKSFVLHIDSLDILEDLTNEQAGLLFKAIKYFQKNEDFQINAVVKIAFSPFKNQFIRDNEKYLLTCKRRAEAGYKGGKAKASKTKQMLANASKTKQTLANLADSDSKSDSDSEKEKEKNIKKENEKITKDLFKNFWENYPEHRRGGTLYKSFKAWKTRRADQPKIYKDQSLIDATNWIKNNTAWRKDKKYVQGIIKFIDEAIWLTNQQGFKNETSKPNSAWSKITQAERAKNEQTEQESFVIEGHCEPVVDDGSSLR